MSLTENDLRHKLLAQKQSLKNLLGRQKYLKAHNLLLETRLARAEELYHSTQASLQSCVKAHEALRQQIIDRTRKECHNK